MLSPFRFLNLCRDAGAPVRGPGREVVAGFLSSPEFTDDKARARWVLRALWCGIHRGAASIAGSVVAQAQAQASSWLSPQEEQLFEHDMLAGFGLPGRWNLPAAHRTRTARSEASGDCTPEAQPEAESGTAAASCGSPGRSIPDDARVREERVTPEAFAELCNRELVSRSSWYNAMRTPREQFDALLSVPLIADAKSRRAWRDDEAPVFDPNVMRVLPRTPASRT